MGILQYYGYILKVTSASTLGDAVWGGASGGPMHCCITWGPRRARGRRGLGFLFPIFAMANAITSPTVKCFRFVWDNLTTFPFGKVSLETAIHDFLVIYSVSRSTLGFMRN